MVDEADSILIDEARIPLVIAGNTDEVVANPYEIADLVRRLQSPGRITTRMRMPATCT